jgi:hypothetical protein
VKLSVTISGNEDISSVSLTVHTLPLSLSLVK